MLGKSLPGSLIYQVATAPSTLTGKPVKMPSSTSQRETATPEGSSPKDAPGVSEAYTTKTFSRTGELLEDGGGATVVVGQDGERMDRDCNGARGIYLQQVCRVRADLRALAVESKYPVPSVWRTCFYRPEVEGVLLSTVSMADISFEEDTTRRSGISSTSVHGSHCRAAVVRPEFIASTAPAPHGRLRAELFIFS